MKPPLVLAAKRADKWEDSNPELEARATKGTLKNLKELGYSDVRVDMTPTMGAGAKPADIPIDALLAVR